MKKKRTIKKEIKSKPIEKISRDSGVEKVLVENFVTLQKVMTHLAAKFDNLSEEIRKLLEIFEISAKAMAEKDFEQLKSSDNKEVLEKLEKLLEQNKIIAKGLTIMGEKNIPLQRPVPEEMSRKLPPQNSGLQGYRASQRF